MTASRAVTVHWPEGPALPIVFDSPHSGRDWPADMHAAAPLAALESGWDAFVEVLWGSAPAHGATLIEAHAPRAYIDCNRALDDIDSDLLAEPWPGPLAPGAKSAAGMGLIRRLALPGIPVYDRKLSVAEIQRRIDDFYHPYHAALRGRLDALHAAFGAVWHIDCHSMKSRGNEMNDDAGQARPDVVVSDRRGTTADPAFTAWCAETLAALGYDVSVNHPYQGAELVRAFGDPARGRHSVQIEINRARYMDETALVPNEGFARLRADLDIFLGQLAGYVRARLAEAPAPR